MIMILLLVIGVVVIGMVIANPTKSVIVCIEAHKVLFPLKIWSVRIENEEKRATFIAWGDPKFQLLNGHMEQLGSSHHFLRDGFNILVTTRKRWSWFTQIDLVAKTMS